MLITICDKCGSRIEENKGRFIFEMDFCPDCTEKLKQVVQAWIDEPEEKKTEVTEEDFKKITAGTLAGLNLESIKRIPAPNAAPVEVSEEDFKKIADQVREKEFKKIADQVSKDLEAAFARKKIDWNKACALKLAGWSNKDIAMELHATEGTINSGIYGKLKTYKPGQHYDD